MSSPNVFSLPDDFVKLVEFEAEDDATAPRSLLDDPEMIAEYIATMPTYPGNPDRSEAQAERRNNDPTFEPDLEAFALKLAKAGKMLQRDIAALEEWEADIRRRRRMRELRLENLRGYLAWYMRAWALDRAKDHMLSLWTAKSPPKVEVEDVAKLPGAYKRITATLDYDAIPGDVLEFLLAFVDTPDVAPLRKAEIEVKKQPIIDAFRDTGEVPDGVEIDATRKHVVWR